MYLALKLLSPPASKLIYDVAMQVLKFIRSRKYGIAFLTLGLVGLIASFTLLTEFIHTLKDPSYIPSCNISVLVTCGVNMESWQGSLFGFSNTILGVMGFTITSVLGLLLLFKTSINKWFWAGLSIGHTAALALVLWLFYQSVFVLGVLCPWCIVVWLVTVPLFFLVNIRTIRAFSFTKIYQFIAEWAWVFITIMFIVMAFIAQLRLDWFSEFSR